MELRVHGIGGPTAEGVLGCGPTVMSWYETAPTHATFRQCVEDPEVQVFHWAPLTSGSRWFALWPLLAPFTLLNLAGWMGPPTRRLGRAHRVLIQLLGLVMTATAVLWLQWTGVVIWTEMPTWLDWVPLDQALRVAVASAVTAFGLMALMVVTATYAARGFEGFRLPSWHDGGPVRGWLGSVDPQLDDPRFFDNHRDRKRRWWVHTLVAALVFLGIEATVIAQGSDELTATLGTWTVVIGGAQFTFLAMVAVVGVLSALRGGRPRSSWRFAGASAAAVSQALLPGLLLAGAILCWGPGSIPPGPAGMLFDVYGWSFLAGLVAVVLDAVVRLLLRSPAEVAGLDGVALVGPVAIFRARLALLIGDLDRPLAAFTLVYLVVGAAVTFVRLRSNPADSWQLTENIPVDAARITFVALIGFLFLGLIKSKANPDSLRRVGNLWDIVTFWPRPFHPFAVRPYAERAVPELQLWLTSAPRRDPVVVAAHSQGTVLAYAALLPLVAQADSSPDLARVLERTRLVTFGSPLRPLYAQAFPRYVDPDRFGDLVDGIGGGAGAGWLNVFRYTDHVGRAARLTDREVADRVASTSDLLLPSERCAAARSDGEIVIPEPGPLGVSGHNDYWQAAAVRAAVASFESEGGT